MAVTEKPKRASPLPEGEVRALIEKGGTPAGIPAKKEERRGVTRNARDNPKGNGGKPKMKLVQLRLSDELLSRIDKARGGRLVRVPRHTWFLEAILKQLSAEEAGLSTDKPSTSSV